MDTVLNITQVPVTVVIPAYNAEEFIEEALQSVRAQSAQPREVIVVDDGSTDRTATIAESCGVKVIRQSNLGLSAARNAAIRVASQDWIALLDADDIWEPDKLASQWAAVLTCPESKLVFTDFSEFSADGPLRRSFFSSLGHYQKVQWIEVAPGIKECQRESLQIQFNNGNFIIPSTVLVQRNLLLEVGMFDEDFRHLEDRELWLRLLAVTKVAVIERPLMRARVHNNNLSSNGLKVAFGIVMVADKVLSNPEKYSINAVEYYRKERPNMYLNAGRYAEQHGEIRKARDCYIRAWRFRGGVRPLVLAILSCFPLPIRSLVRASLRQFIGARLSENPARRRAA